jgi:hypothetical protein
MDCKTARLLLDFARPHLPDLEAPDMAQLENHLADCPDCARLAHRERDFDDSMRQAMLAVPVPADLSSRLLTHLAAERRAWYWRLPRRYPARAAAIAALLLLALGALAYWATRPLPLIDFTREQEEADPQAMASPQKVEQYFAQQGYAIVAPVEFNYTYLDSWGIDIFKGQRVPWLRFVRGEFQATVYILSARQFDLKASLDQPANSSGRFTFLLRADPDNPDNPRFAYLIKYTGPSLQWFQDEQRGRDNA